MRQPGMRPGKIKRNEEELQMVRKGTVLGIALCVGILLVLSAGALVQAQVKVNVNTATAGELEKVPGLSGDMAKAVVETRAKSGSFKSASDLMKVPGMTKEKADAIAPALAFGPAGGGPDEEEAKLPRY